MKVFALIVTCVAVPKPLALASLPCRESPRFTGVADELTPGEVSADELGDCTSPPGVTVAALPMEGDGPMGDDVVPPWDCGVDKSAPETDDPPDILESWWPMTTPIMPVPTERITTATNVADRNGLPQCLTIRYPPKRAATTPNTKAMILKPARRNATTPATSATKPTVTEIGRAHV